MRSLGPRAEPESHLGCAGCAVTINGLDPSAVTYVGSIEQQIGHKLHSMVVELRSTSAKADEREAGSPGDTYGRQASSGHGAADHADSEGQGGDEEAKLALALQAGERLEQVECLAATTAVSHAHTPQHRHGGMMM
jgi:hypothetical protein